LLRSFNDSSAINFNPYRLDGKKYSNSEAVEQFTNEDDAE